MQYTRLNFKKLGNKNCLLSSHSKYFLTFSYTLIHNKYSSKRFEIKVPTVNEYHAHSVHRTVQCTGQMLALFESTNCTRHSHSLWFECVLHTAFMLLLSGCTFCTRLHTRSVQYPYSTRPLHSLGAKVCTVYNPHARCLNARILHGPHPCSFQIPRNVGYHMLCVYERVWYVSVKMSAKKSEKKINITELQY